MRTHQWSGYQAGGHRKKFPFQELYYEYCLKNVSVVFVFFKLIFSFRLLMKSLTAHHRNAVPRKECATGHKGNTIVTQAVCKECVWCAQSGEGFTKGHKWCLKETPISCGQDCQPITLADMDSQSNYVNGMVILYKGYLIYTRSYFVITLHTGRIGMEGVPSSIIWYCKLDTGVQ